MKKAFAVMIIGHKNYDVQGGLYKGFAISQAEAEGLAMKEYSKKYKNYCIDSVSSVEFFRSDFMSDF